MNWDIISEDVNTLAGAISCTFEYLGEVVIIRTGELDGFFSMLLMPLKKPIKG